MVDNSTKHILVVDDDPSLCRLVARRLEKMDMNVDAVTSGGAALKQLDKEKYDIVLLDLGLPDCDGVELLPRVTATADCIVVTGRVDLDTATKMMRHGARDYIVKGEDFLEQICWAVRRVNQIAEYEKTILSAEMEARKERMHMQQMLDTAEAVIVVLDSDLKVRQINQYACRLLGYEESYLLERSWLEVAISNEETGNEVRKQVASLYSGRVSRISRNESAIISRGGERYVLAWCMSSLVDETGSVEGVLAVGVDITGQAAQLETLSCLAESLPLPMLTIDEANCVSKINHRFVTATGYHPEDFSTIDDILDLMVVDPEECQRIKDLWALRLDALDDPGDCIEPIRVICQCKDRSVKTFDVHVSHVGKERAVVWVEIAKS